MSLLNFNFTVKQAEKRKADDEPTDPETPRNKDLKYDREKRTRIFQNSWIDKFPWVVFDENAQEMYCKYCRKFPHLSDRKDVLTRGTKNLRIDGLKLHDKYQEHLLCVKHWFKELDDPQAAADPSQAFADTPIGQSLLKLDESQRKRLESLFNTAYGVVKAGKPFSDYELICEIQVKNGLDLGENYRNINGCKNLAASIAQTLVDKPVQELKNINFLCILSDGSTDVSVTEQEIVYIHYVERSVPVTKIISIEALDKTDTQGIFNAIKNALDKLSLNFDKLKPNKYSFPSLICANFDGASVNLDQKGGVIAKIRDVIPDVMGLHCVAHKLELTAHDATCVPKVTNILSRWKVQSREYLVSTTSHQDTKMK